jgi:hypothetical protein
MLHALHHLTRHLLMPFRSITRRSLTTLHDFSLATNTGYRPKGSYPSEDHPCSKSSQSRKSPPLRHLDPPGVDESLPTMTGVSTTTTDARGHLPVGHQPAPRRCVGSGKLYLSASASVSFAPHVKCADAVLNHPHYPHSRISPDPGLWRAMAQRERPRRPKHRDTQHRRPRILRTVRISLQIDDDDPFKRLDQDVHGFLPPPRVHRPSSPLTRRVVQELVGSPIRPSLPSLPLSPPIPNHHPTSHALSVLSSSRCPSPPPLVSLSLTDSLLPCDGHSRPIDISLPDPLHSARGQRKHNEVRIICLFLRKTQFSRPSVLV